MTTLPSPDSTESIRYADRSWATVEPTPNALHRPEGGVADLDAPDRKMTLLGDQFGNHSIALFQSNEAKQ